MSKHRWVSWLFTFVALYALYLLFAATLTKSEVLGGMGAAVIATVAAGLFGAVGSAKFIPTPHDLLQAWRIPYYAFTGTFELFKALARQLFTARGADSLIASVRYDVGGDDPKSSARRALAELYTAMTPNFVVLGIVHKQRLLLYHQVLKGEVLQMTTNLGAHP